MRPAQGPRYSVVAGASDSVVLLSEVRVLCPTPIRMKIVIKGPFALPNSQRSHKSGPVNRFEQNLASTEYSQYSADTNKKTANAEPKNPRRD